MADLRTPTEIDVDDTLAILAAMWRGFKNSWNVDDIEWCAASDDATRHSKLVDKAALVAVTEFLVRRLNMQIEEGFNVTDLEKIEEFCKKVMEKIPSRFWLMEWTERQLDTSAGRGLIRQSLATIRTAAATGADDALEEAVLVPSHE